MLVTSGFNSLSGLESPLSLLGPREEYDAIVSSSLSTVLISSVAPTVMERLEDPIPLRPSMSGPSFPAATLTTNQMLVALSSNSAMPFLPIRTSCLVRCYSPRKRLCQFHERTHWRPCGHRLCDRLSIVTIHCRFVKFLFDNIIFERTCSRSVPILTSTRLELGALP